MRTWAMGLCALLLSACATQTAATQPQPTEPAQPAQEEATISPERADAIERVFARKASELQQCWTDEYQKTHDRKIQGDVTVQMNVAPSGQATDVQIVKSTLGSPPIDACVVQTVSGWDFPSGSATVPYSRTVHLGAQY